MAQGKIIYFNSAAKSERYFESIGFQVPEFSNPADFYMAMMSIESYEVEETMDNSRQIRSKDEVQQKYREKIQNFHEKYQESSLKCDPDEVDDNAPPLSDQTDIITYRANICKQYFLILLRAFRNIWRIPLASYVKFITIVIIACLIILIFQPLKTDIPSIQNRNGVLFFFTLNCVFNAIQSLTLLFPDE